jgi:trk system potassium uptake protein TrkA
MAISNPANPRSSGTETQDANRGGVLIVGLGRFGEALARGLVEQNIEVLAVDFNEEIVQRVSGDIPHVVQCDSTSSRALRQIGAEQFSRAVVAIASNIEASVLSALVLIDELKIPVVWAKAISLDHAKILERVGVTRVIQPEHDMGLRTARSIARRVTDYFHIDDDFALVEMEAPKGCLGRPLGELGIRKKFAVTIVCIKPPGGEFQHAEQTTILEPGELILLAGKPADLDAFVIDAE